MAKHAMPSEAEIVQQAVSIRQAYDGPFAARKQENRQHLEFMLGVLVLARVGLAAMALQDADPTSPNKSFGLAHRKHLDAVGTASAWFEGEP